MTINLAEQRRAFHADLCDELLVLENGVASNADGGQVASVQIAASIANALGAREGKKLAGQTAGLRFEKAVERFLKATFGSGISGLRPGEWRVECIQSRSSLVIAQYEQYSHLEDVRKIAKDNPDLAAAIGLDYAVASDIVVARIPETDDAILAAGLDVQGSEASASPLRTVNNNRPLMHASVSCKWTIRSDRAQNSRFEALNLIRSRKGRVPHIVVVTGEPTPSRLSSLALGTGDMDCIYHFALPELVTAVADLGQSEAIALLNIMIEGKRLRDIADLPLDLSI
jgi:hypothetical protein